MKKILVLILITAISLSLEADSRRSIPKSGNHGGIIPLESLELTPDRLEFVKKGLQEKYPNFSMYLTGAASETLVTLLDCINNSNAPVIVQFYADWCGPCRRMKPIVQEVSSHFGNQITIITVNVDSYPQLRTIFDVMYIPTFVFFKDGLEVKRTNSIAKDEMITVVKTLL